MKKFTFLTVITLAMVLLAGCRKKELAIINSIEDLTGKTIGCQAGTTGELYLQEETQDVKIKSFKTGIDAAIDLKNGAIDALILDDIPAKEIVKANPTLKIVDLEFSKEEYAIAVRKGDTELLESINSTIKAMKSDGTFETLSKTFMPADGNIILPQKIETPGNEIIKMGTNVAFPPFEYTEGSSAVGFDITLSQIIALNYGKKLQVVDMAFDGLIAALQAGSIDFIAAGMTATDERKKNVDFSDPYFITNQVILVRSK